ncbi:uncharacterized protein A4U43_C04F32670 [Asparagus officinalis]|uniref:Uncharacterized protein n=1 Tax=Asparagus officinalis TaxID=4686 RepID=A0A5P1F595_ASPOF|nr:uncharacterized protein A4U43_C04F32670 [Asparagus officinalis]
MEAERASVEGVQRARRSGAGSRKKLQALQRASRRAEDGAAEAAESAASPGWRSLVPRSAKGEDEVKTNGSSCEYPKAAAAKEVDGGKRPAVLQKEVQELRGPG